MDNSPKGLRRSITALETEFHKLLRDAPWKHGKQPQSPQSQTQEKSDRCPGEIAVIPPSPQDTGSTTGAKKNSIPWWRIVEGIGILAAGVVAVVNGLQWRDANRNFRIDQRPWIRIETALINSTDPVDATNGMVIKTFKVGAPITIPIRIHNAGKLPALGTEAAVLIQIADTEGRALVLPNGKYVGTSVLPLMAIPRIRLEIVFPNGSSSTIRMSRYGTENGHNGVIDLKPDEAKVLADGTSRIYIVARIDYRDPFGKEHWTTLCKSVSEMTESLRCEQYNATDTNF